MITASPTNTVAEDFELARTDPKMWVIKQFFIGKTNGVQCNTRNVLALQAARALGREDEVRRLILMYRKHWLTWHILTQRDWQTKVSRRPQRNRHHDSWSIRESYVRCTSERAAYYAYSKPIWDRFHNTNSRNRGAA